jgi:serine/threonine protein kinase
VYHAALERVFPQLRCERQLPDHRAGRRWLARDRGAGWPRLVYLLGFPNQAPPAVQESLAALHAARLPHAQSIELFHIEGGALWIVSPYPGSYEGLTSLSALLASRQGGRLGPFEALRAARHVLQALHAGHGLGVPHGPVRPDEVIVDTRGSVQVELFGVDRCVNSLHTAMTDSERRAEVVSVGRLAHELLTGLAPAPMPDDVRKLRRDLPAKKMRWVRAACLGEFATASHALDALGPLGQ